MSASLIQCDPLVYLKLAIYVAVFMVAQGFGRTEMPFTFRSGIYAVVTSVQPESG
jgi:hypothetical protein